MISDSEDVKLLELVVDGDKSIQRLMRSQLYCLTVKTLPWANIGPTGGTIFVHRMHVNAL